MAQPLTLQNASNQTQNGPLIRKLKKGELLFQEGENSRAMYLIKSGMIRIFKKKSDTASIEIDTIRAGQILGELAFLDGNPRSASGEALSDCELVEISGATFTSVLGSMPDWLKIMLKTIVGRLRTASTRIRQLEQATASLDYSGSSIGQKYLFLTPAEVLKGCTALVLCASKYGTPSNQGIAIQTSMLVKFGNHIMQVAESKLTALVDALTQVGVLAAGPQELILVKDLVYLDLFLSYYHDENLLDSSKKRELSQRGFAFMSLLIKYQATAQKVDETSIRFSVGKISNSEVAAGNKDLFKFEDIMELVQRGYCTDPKTKDFESMSLTLKTDALTAGYKMQRILNAIGDVNRQKAQNKAPAK